MAFRGSRVQIPPSRLIKAGSELLAARLMTGRLAIWGEVTAARKSWRGLGVRLRCGALKGGSFHNLRALPASSAYRPNQSRLTDHQRASKELGALPSLWQSLARRTGRVG